MELKKSEIKAIKTIISLLSVAFCWADSPQGNKYWNKVQDNLRKLIKK